MVNTKIEKHPYGPFVPNNSKYLILGTFAAKPAEGYDWYFGTKRNQFWSILESVYQVELPTVMVRKELFDKLKIAITDMIISCRRKDNNSADTNLIDMVYDNKTIKNILKKNNIEKIFFTSRFAENLWKKKFTEIANNYPNIQYITLPSPSPRYARMSKQEKISKYKILMPNND